MLLAMLAGLTAIAVNVALIDHYDDGEDLDVDTGAEV